MNDFINSQFGYCPLIWICHSRTTHSMLNKIHERALRIVYRDNSSSFAQLLKISDRNLQVLATEIYKAINNLSSLLMSELFKRRETKYNLRNRNILVSTSIKTTTYGTSSINHLAPKIWSLVPKEIKYSASLDIFKRKNALVPSVNCYHNCTNAI